MSDPLADAQASLTAARDRARRALMGPALNVADSQLDTLASADEADLPSAEALWREANPGPLGDLLDAEPVEE